MEQQNIGHLFKQITDKIKGTIDASLKENDLTLSQVRVLDYISTKGGVVTQKSIEEHLGVSHPTVAGIVSRMEKKEYLICYADKDDKRNKIVEITEPAAKIMQEVRGEVVSMEKRLVKGLTEEEIEVLLRILKVVFNNLN